MTDTSLPATDPSVCYRHPGRQSWVLCQRCGRTVCPECQILAPVGVHCPECVRETSGGVAWRPTNAAPPRPRRTRTQGSSFGRARSMLLGRTGGGAATLTWTLIGANVLTFLVNAFTGGFATVWLAAVPGAEWQVWRFVTAGLDSQSVLSLLLGGLFMWLTGTQVERMLGVARFAAIVTVATVAGSCGALLAGGLNYGLTAPLFGAFATVLVTAWHDQRARTQILVMLGINAVLAIVTGGAPALALIVAAFLGGAGTMWVLQHRGENAWTRNPALTVGGATVALVVITVAKSLLL